MKFVRQATPICLRVSHCHSLYRLSIRAGLQRLSVALYHFLLTVAEGIRDAADYWSILSVGLGVDRLQRSFGLPRTLLLAALFFPSEPVIA